MKKVFIVMLVISCLLALCGCCKADVSTVTVGDFALPLPDGYTITNISNIKCTIVKGDVAIGGVILTPLTPKTMDEKLPLYLDSITGTEVINEYFCWDAEASGTPVKLVSHYVTDPETNTKEEFYRIIFVKDGGIYDMWFDTELIGIDEVEEYFYPLF